MTEIEFTYVNCTRGLPNPNGGYKYLQLGTIFGIYTHKKSLDIHPNRKYPIQRISGKLPDDIAHRIIKIHEEDDRKSINCDSHGYVYAVQGWQKHPSDLHTSRHPSGQNYKDDRLVPGKPYGFFRDEDHLFSGIAFDRSYMLTSIDDGYTLVIAGAGLIKVALGSNKICEISNR